MSEVVKVYQETTSDGVFEIEEFDNGVKGVALIEPSAEYLQRIADQPAPLPPGPTELELLRERVDENQGAIDFILMNS